MKRIFLLAAMLGLVTLTFGQFTLGPKIGVNMSKLSTNIEDVTEDMKTGFQFGAFARFGKKLYVQPEVLFSTKGGNIKFKNYEDIEAKINLNTIEIPVEVGFKLLNLNVVSLNIMGGPSVSLVVKEEIEYSDGVEDPITEDHIKNTIWNFNLGVGLDVLMFTFDVRYNWGLNNILEPTNEASNDMKNNMWTVSLGWMIL
jgi:hypothetical protein